MKDNLTSEKEDAAKKHWHQNSLVKCKQAEKLLV